MDLRTFPLIALALGAAAAQAACSRGEIGRDAPAMSTRPSQSSANPSLVPVMRTSIRTSACFAAKAPLTAEIIGSSVVDPAIATRPTGGAPAPHAATSSPSATSETVAAANRDIT